MGVVWLQGVSHTTRSSSLCISESAPAGSVVGTVQVNDDTMDPIVSRGKKSEYVWTKVGCRWFLRATRPKETVACLIVLPKIDSYSHQPFPNRLFALT